MTPGGGPPPAPDAPKQQWRSWARGVRSGLELASAAEQIVAGLRSWGAIAPGTRVLVFDPLLDEPDVMPAAADGVALLTRTPAEGGLTIHEADGPLERHRLGFRQPAADAAPVDPGDVDLVLVPGLAFARDGGRLGRGGGYYDRLLPRFRPGTPFVGIVPDGCLVERLPMTSDDVPVTHLATESGVVAVAPDPALDGDLVARTETWISGDPDAGDRAALEALLATGASDELAERMAGTLEFGTAGIRGAVEAGSNRMNRATVIRTTRGLADFLAAAGRSDGVVVLGFDGRLSSRTFAADAVGVLSAAGIAVRYFDRPVPTPLVAHTAVRLDAVAAVVVTASHNPPRDNGYKVYDADGAQIVPPVDTRIAEAIEAVGPAADVPRVEGALDGASETARPLGGSDVAAYVDTLLEGRAPVDGRPLRIVYTPMHGTGRDVLVQVFDAAGHRDLHVVPEQADPDGRFPTVDFPNPEEPGALDLAVELAGAVDADLVLANDPDADRLAAVVPGPDGLRPLTGNQIGVLLGDFVLEHRGGPDALVVNSIVSTPMLAAVADHHGARFEQTLTGFKWIANAALRLERQEGLRFVFGFEEALGYTIGRAVRDKDGIGAALWFADLAAASPKGVLARLEGLYRRDGMWVSTQTSVVRPGTEGREEIDGAMAMLRDRRPDRLGGSDVVGVTDFREGAGDRPPWLPATPLVAFDLGPLGRALVRPSGTEPKLKIYVDLRRELGEGDDVWETEARAREDAGAIGDELVEFLGLG